MKIEQQVCSLELAKRLKELGVRQESLFYWCKTAPFLTSSRTFDPPKWKELHIFSDYEKKQIDYIESDSAFTVAELGAMLPIWHDSCKREKNDWYVRVFEKSKDNIVHNSFDTTEANARAKMLIYLIENGLYEPS